ncbi:MAG: methionine gamma-lyase family protein [Candidatus Improbicoccus pseudotrichonymphae]|uniref:Methionine gamma-lyase family protein n=1 Tax=Candidatus Improbicoccus pseudotrichonymphae TaxID=3033792 RepID=A0AA48KYT1_9FIRM|nr:MAG: methionine gamma-lyase family protein [Candidatus Improbicoccus pseudotrichonymphae]
MRKLGHGNYSSSGIGRQNKRILDCLRICEEKCTEIFGNIEKICEENSRKVLKAFIENKVSENHFRVFTGYGYGNIGKEVLNKLVSQIMCTESALVDENFISATHALNVSLFAITKPGDTILSVTGAPYDTLKKTIYGKNTGSLRDFGIKFKISNFKDENFLDLLNNDIKVIYIQRSCGYSLRESLKIRNIESIIKKIKKRSDALILVDNCYGEFVQEKEPTEVGADLIVGSLIKNPGAGIAPSGAYLAGKRNLIELCLNRFAFPGAKLGIGPSKYNRELLMGFYYAPMVVKEALKTAVFAALFFETLGFEVSPKYNEERSDIIQAINFKNRENLLTFCQEMQSTLAIDSFVTPTPWKMPGYQNEIIMSSGGFISGSTIELSCDAPMQKPYSVFLQGGTNFYMSKFSILNAAMRLVNNQ